MLIVAPLGQTQGSFVKMVLPHTLNAGVYKVLEKKKHRTYRQLLPARNKTFLATVRRELTLSTTWLGKYHTAN